VEAEAALEGNLKMEGMCVGSGGIVGNYVEPRAGAGHGGGDEAGGFSIADGSERGGGGVAGRCGTHAR